MDETTTPARVSRCREDGRGSGAADRVARRRPTERSPLWPFPSDDERRQWFYTPTDHGGLTLAAMTPPQHRLVFRLVASGLSTAGYVTASTIIGLENVLDQLEGFTASFERAAWPRSADVLRAHLRPAVGHRHVELAARRSSHLVELHDHRRRARGDDSAVPRRRSGQLATARAASAAAARRRRGPRPRADPLALRRAARHRRRLATSADRSGRRQPTVVGRRRPTDRATAHLAAAASSGEIGAGLQRIAGAADCQHRRHRRPISRRCRSPAGRRGWRPRRWTRSQRQMLDTLLRLLRRSPARRRLPTTKQPSSPARRSTTCTCCGRAGWSPASRTTTGCTARSCWPSTTTPLATPITCTPCGAIRVATSPTTRSPVTTPNTITVNLSARPQPA